MTPTRKDRLGLVNLGGKVPTCPLCLNKMVRAYEASRHIYVYACHIDKVAIHVNDPFVNNWDQAYENAMKSRGVKIECPVCNAEMRYFATSTGFMKAKCPKKGCGATVHTSEPDRRASDSKTTPGKPGVVQ